MKKIVIDNNKSFEPCSNFKAPYGSQLHVVQDATGSFFLYLQTNHDESRPTWEFCGYFIDSIYEHRAIDNYIKKKLESIEAVES